MRLPPTVTVLVVVGLLLFGCGTGGGSAGPCGPITREALDPRFLVHVLGNATVDYTSNPPTSGPHQPTPDVAGVRTEPISRPLQVGILERGDVLLQYRPDLPGEQRDGLESLAGPDVVVAPNNDLDEAVVATAWLYRRSCSSVDTASLTTFVEQRRGKGPDAEADAS